MIILESVPYPRHDIQTRSFGFSIRHCLRNGFDAGADSREVIPWEIERSWSRGAVSVAIKGSWSGVAAIRVHHRHSLRGVAVATGGERRMPRPATSQSERPEQREEVPLGCALSNAKKCPWGAP